MSFAVTVKDAQDLRKLIPLNILSASRFEALCAEVGIEEVPRGGILFRQGDGKNEFVYVLSGTVSLQAGGMEMETIAGGSESARFALAHQIPRKVSAVAKDRVRFIRVDAVYVNQPNEKISVGKATYEVSDMADDAEDDWVTTLLKSPIFQRLPPANLQNILSLLEEVPVKAGQEIVRQDEPGDYYYVIKRGGCVLTRKPSRLARELKLAELKTCDTFGEDSLISDQPRNVTVTMLTDGALLRLSKANFLKLVKEPVIAYVSMDAAQRMIQQGAAWLDVRTTAEFEEGHLPDSVNVPFFQLRMELPRLNRNVKCILVCDTGRLSEAAAFLLIRHEFDAYVLKGGISGVFKDQLVSGGGGSQAQTPMASLESRKVGEVSPMPRGAIELEASPEDLTGEPAKPASAREDRDEGAAAASGQAPGQLAELHRQLAKEVSSGSLLAAEWQALEDTGSRILADSEQHLASAQSLVERQAAALEVLKAQALGLKESWGSAEVSTAAAEQDSARRCAAAMAERSALEVQLNELRASSEARLQTVLGESQKASEGLKLRLGQAEHSLREALAEKRAMAERMEDLAGSARHLEEARQALARSEAANLVLQDQRRSAETRADGLAGQVSELSALVQEFVDHQQARVAGGDQEQIDSLIAELETVRIQADEDVAAMQAKLRSSEREMGRLRQELDAIREQLLKEDVERERRAELPVDARPQARSGWLGVIWQVLYALILVGLGAALLAVLLAGTEDGKSLSRQVMEALDAGRPVSLDSAPER